MDNSVEFTDGAFNFFNHIHSVNVDQTSNIQFIT